MNVSVVWIDREQAHIYLLSKERMERRSFRAHHLQPHRHLRDALDQKRAEQELFQEVGEALEGSDKILILGPGIAKHHFQNYMNEQKPLLAKKIQGVETVDHPTDGEIAAMARSFYQKVIA